MTQALWMDNLITICNYDRVSQYTWNIFRNLPQPSTKIAFGVFYNF